MLQAPLIFAIWLVLASVVSGDEIIAFAGSTQSAPTWDVPDIEQSAYGAITCTVGSYDTNYVSFPVSFDSDGVRQVIGISSISPVGSTLGLPDIDFYVYKGTSFSSATPCSSIYSGRLGGHFYDEEGPATVASVFFSAGDYTFVASGDGEFAINVFPSEAQGHLTDSSDYWILPEVSYTGDCSYATDIFDDIIQIQFDSYTWTQETSGKFDVRVLFDNRTALYYAQVTALLFEGQPDSYALQNNSCSTNHTILQYVASTTPASWFADIDLTAGKVYTLVFSNLAQENVYWGIQIVPTRIRFLNQSGYTQPQKNLPCSASPYNTDSSWDSISIPTSSGQFYMMSAGSVPSSLPYEYPSVYLYNGENLSNPPQTCPSSPSLAEASYFTVVGISGTGTTYTAIVAAEADEAVTAYALYFFTGTLVGTLPTTLSGSSGTNTFSITGTNTVTGTNFATSFKANVGFITVSLAIILII